jgi:hypothetical protein
MKHVLKIFSSAALLVICLLLAACSGIPGGNSGGGGGGGGTGGPFTISVSVIGLQGTGLVMTNNITDKLTITGSGMYKFATTITKGATYAVAVSSQPVNPGQICVVPQGASGTATANITLSVTCTTGAFSIGGNVNKLQGSGLILQNSTAGGIEKLSITGNGAFTFINPVATNGAYAVTVLAQPINPVQTCVVVNGTGTAANNVGNVQVTCSVGTIPIGGSVVGLDGTGLTLLDNGGDSLVITGNGPFTFPTLLVSGVTYTVTVSAQPTGPSQTCTVQSNGTGTAAAPGISNVLISCPPIFETISGNVVGVSIPNGMTSQLVLQNNGGDNLPVPDNGPFTFVTPIAYGSSYDVSVFVKPGTQNQGVIYWNYQGKAITPVTDVTIDWGHNDWAWLNGKNTSNQSGAFGPVVLPLTAFSTNSPGGRKYAATWSDHSGNLWMFGGYGFTLTTFTFRQPWALGEMWAYNGAQSYFGGIPFYWNLISPLPPPAAAVTTPSPRFGAVTWTDPATGHLMLFGGQDYAFNFLSDFWEFTPTPGPPLGGTWTQLAGGGVNLNGVYGTQGSPAPGNWPGGRWGSTTQLDSAGNVWLFGGFGYDTSSRTPGLLNDLWKYNTATGRWTWMSAANWTGATTTNTVNQDGVYGTVGTPGGGPGGRQSMVSFLDKAGNFWIFGGYNLSGTGTPNAFNDLWEYNATSGEWTWVSGASSTNQAGNYGTVGVSASTNVPGARWAPAAWTDAQGFFWVFGGQGYDPAGNGSLGDLWAYNPNAPATPPDPNPYLPASAQWIWVKGPNSVSQPGDYGIDPSGTLGTFWPHVTNHVSSRYGAAFWYQPDLFNQPQFFLFGGEGFDSTTTDGNGLLNDLQRYVPYP